MSSRPASGTNSLIFGERLSVRLPRRIVPICVSDPIGLARSLADGDHAGDGGGADGAEADEQDAELALRRSDFNRCRHGEKLYHHRVDDSPFRGASNPYMLVVGMTGVKMGDRMRADRLRARRPPRRRRRQGRLCRAAPSQSCRRSLGGARRRRRVEGRRARRSRGRAADATARRTGQRFDLASSTTPGCSPT